MTTMFSQFYLRLESIVSEFLHLAGANRSSCSGLMMDHLKNAHLAALDAAKNLMEFFKSAEVNSVHEVDSAAAATEIMDVIDAYAHLWDQSKKLC